ncbi:MAG: hypothetical protein PVG84_17960 [Desulfobacterales bacterium]|jgi:hypothetical protein
MPSAAASELPKREIAASSINLYIYGRPYTSYTSFYGESIPVVTVDKEGFQSLKTGLHAVIDGIKGEIVLAGI